MNEKGRSMIEMLGVLAIVGILSIGGIAGFSKAMMNYKLNALAAEYVLFLQGIKQYVKELCKTNTTGSYQSISKYVKTLNIVPDKWRYEKNGQIFDSMGYRMAIYAADDATIALNYYISQEDSLLTKEEMVCRKIWADVIIPAAGALYQVRMLSGGVVKIRTYGDNYCHEKDALCISEVTISEIVKMCKSCDNHLCYLDIYLK